MDGKTVDGPRDLARMIAGYPPETEVTLGIWRDGEKQDIEVTLGQLQDKKTVASLEKTGKDTAFVDSLGVELASAARVGAAERGVVVTGVADDSPVIAKGLKQGDVILEVAGKPVSDPGDVAGAVMSASESGRKAVLMRVESNGTTRFVAVPVARG